MSPNESKLHVCHLVGAILLQLHAKLQRLGPMRSGCMAMTIFIKWLIISVTCNYCQNVANFGLIFVAHDSDAYFPLFLSKKINFQVVTLIMHTPIFDHFSYFYRFLQFFTRISITSHPKICWATIWWQITKKSAKHGL